MPRNGDLTITWDEGNHDAMIAQIQALMDRGVAFYKLTETGKIRRKVVASPIVSTDDITDRRILITDAEIEKLLPTMMDLCRNVGLEPPPPPDKPLRRSKDGKTVA
jgi:hypothetical protein